MAQLAASSLYVARFDRDSDHDRQARRLQRHLSHPLLAELVELGETMTALQEQHVIPKSVPFHALAQEALAEIGS